jgi:uncharacterized membrane protein
MEAFFGLLGTLAAVVVFVLPIVAYVTSQSTKRRVQTLERELELNTAKLTWLYDETKRLRAAIDSERAERAERAERPARVEQVEALARDASDTAPSAPALGDARNEIASSSPKATPTAGAAPASIPASPESATPTSASAEAPALPASPPPPPRAAPPRPATPPKPPTPPLEERLGTYITRVGAAALVLGILYFFKYAVDNDWIGPMGRVAIGAAFGLVCLGASEPLRQRARGPFVGVVVGLGVAALMISSFAASALYDLVPHEVAFGANCVILLLATALAVRHDAEAILVLALVAAVANPIVLSTGQDRPVALFSYLLSMTGVMTAVAVKRRFRFAAALALVGNLVLFAGWYERYFDTHDLLGVVDDDAGIAPVGAYHAASARWSPLAYVALTSATWIALAFQARRWGRSGRWSAALAVVGLLLAHGGGVALLFDLPVALGAALVLVGIAAIATLGALERTELAFVPMSAALIAFAVASGASEAEHVPPLLAALAGWTALYVGTSARRLRAMGTTLPPGAVVALVLALVGFLGIAASLLLPRGDVFVFVGLLALVSAVAAYVVELAPLRSVALGGLVVGFVFWFAAAPELRSSERAADPRLLAALAAWTAIQVVMLARVARREGPPAFAALFAIALALVGSLGVITASTSADLPNLRAIWATLVAGGAAALATWARRAIPTWVEPLGALTLGLVAVGLGLALSGPALTLAWGLLLVVAAWLHARHPAPGLATAVVALAAAVVLRVLAFDVGRAEEAIALWRNTEGRLGVYALTPWLNARALGVSGAAMAFVLSGWRLGRGAPVGSITRGGAAALLVGGYVMFSFVLVTELQASVRELPTPPTALLDPVEFSVFLDALRDAERAQLGRSSTMTTLVLAVVAMALLAVGFGARDAFHRWLGLGTFLLTIAKLALYDVWNLPRTYQIVVLVGVGVLLLGSGFLYARLKSLFRGDDGGGGEGSGPRPAAAAALVAALVGAAIAPGAARAQDAPRVDPAPFASRRSVQGAEVAGTYQLAVDHPLYAASRGRVALEDLRVVDANLRAVPHVIREAVEAPPTIDWRTIDEAAVSDRGELDDGATRATFELPSGFVHCRVELSIDGPTPYLRRVMIELGDDPNALARADAAGVAYAVQDGEGGWSRSGEVGYPRALARYVRVTLRPDVERRTHRITSARFGCPAEAPPPEPRVDTLPVTIVRVERVADRRQTEVELDVGAEGLPLESLVLDLGTPEFARPVTIRASTSKSAWPVTGGGYVYRVEGALEDGGTTIGLRGVRKRWLRVTIDDADDAPLELRGAKVTLLRRQLVVRAPGGPLALLVGAAEVSGPSYDLTATLARRTPTPLPVATLGPVEPNPDFGRAREPDDAPWSEKNRGVIRGVLAVVMLGLAAWAVRLLRAGSGEAGGAGGSGAAGGAAG